MYQLFLADPSRVIAVNTRELDVNKYLRKSYREDMRRVTIKMGSDDSRGTSTAVV